MTSVVFSLNQSRTPTKNKSCIKATMLESDEDNDSEDETLSVNNNDSDKCMSNEFDEDCDPKTPELDYDMWEGQFEFVGPNSDQQSSDLKLYGLLKIPPTNSIGQRGNKFVNRANNIGSTYDKVQELQQQMGVFQDSANHNNERYTKVKADNAALQVRVIMLEEQLRETELRYEERLQDEQKRSKELTSRIDRERQLQLENSGIRLQAAESEAGNAKDELYRQRARIEKLEQERKQLTDHVQDLRNELLDYKEQEHAYKETERRLIKEQDVQVHLIDELSHEVEKLRAESRTPALPTTSPEALRLDELHEEMTLLREKNQQLLEVNEELQASILHAGVEQGRKLTAGVDEFSLKAELEAMSQDEPDKPLKDAESVAKMQQALKDLQDVNNDLRTYIDGILLNIVENYPQLLEVKLKRSA